jgi:hypothetical protein
MGAAFVALAVLAAAAALASIPQTAVAATERSVSFIENRLKLVINKADRLARLGPSPQSDLGLKTCDSSPATI